MNTRKRLLCGGMFFAVLLMARADDSFLEVTVDGHEGYIVPASYALGKDNHFGELMTGELNLHPDEFNGFWTPTLDQVEQAEKLTRRLIREGVKSPAVAFPEIARNP